MIDSVFGSDMLKNAVNSLNDQYIQNDYEVLSLIKTEGVNRIFCNKTDFMLFIMVKKTTPILLILSEINCFKNSASNLASDK